MNNAIIIQHAFPNRGFDKMLELTRAHNEKYCQKFGFDYRVEIYHDPKYDWLLGAWEKITLIHAAMKANYKYIVWLDADAMIIDTDTDLRKAIEPEKIGASWHRIPQLNHWNVGVLYVHNSPETLEFVERWLASYPPPADGWNEQGVFNRIGRECKTVVTVSDKWNATIDVNIVPDSVVLGFHGQGNAEQRYNMMAETFTRLFPAESDGAG